MGVSMLLEKRIDSILRTGGALGHAGGGGRISRSVAMEVWQVANYKHLAALKDLPILTDNPATPSTFKVA